ncbi:unnamed protein product [Amoebophrya sp. A120]|nr:unnamed protein product [Amoebophrya sp. A120]|eukprot:GSA120T00000186001.1
MQHKNSAGLLSTLLESEPFFEDFSFDRFGFALEQCFEFGEVQLFSDRRDDEDAGAESNKVLVSGVDGEKEKVQPQSRTNYSLSLPLIFFLESGELQQQVTTAGGSSAVVTTSATSEVGATGKNKSTPGDEGAVSRHQVLQQRIRVVGPSFVVHWDNYIRAAQKSGGAVNDSSATSKKLSGAAAGVPPAGAAASTVEQGVLGDRKEIEDLLSATFFYGCARPAGENSTPAYDPQNKKASTAKFWKLTSLAKFAQVLHSARLFELGSFAQVISATPLFSALSQDQHRKIAEICTIGYRFHFSRSCYPSASDKNQNHMNKVRSDIDRETAATEPATTSSSCSVTASGVIVCNGAMHFPGARYPFATRPASGLVDKIIKQEEEQEETLNYAGAGGRPVACAAEDQHHQDGVVLPQSVLVDPHVYVLASGRLQIWQERDQSVEDECVGDHGSPPSGRADEELYNQLSGEIVGPGTCFNEMQIISRTGGGRNHSVTTTTASSSSASTGTDRTVVQRRGPSEEGDHDGAPHNSGTVVVSCAPPAAAPRSGNCGRHEDHSPPTKIKTSKPIVPAVLLKFSTAEFLERLGTLGTALTANDREVKVGKREGENDPDEDEDGESDY